MIVWIAIAVQPDSCVCQNECVEVVLGRSLSKRDPIILDPKIGLGWV